MYLSELLAALRRRWWLVALGLVATLALVVVGRMLVPAQEQIQASVLVLPPASTTKDVGNPFLALGGLQPAADVLARAMNSGTVQDDLAPRTGTAAYSVNRDTGSSGPILVVQATDRTAAGASAALDRVLNRIPQVFAQLQSATGVTGDATMTVTPLARDTQPVASTKSQVRAMILAGVLGLAATVFGTSFIDGLVLRRRSLARRRRALRDEPAGPDPDPAPGVLGRAGAQVPEQSWDLIAGPEDATPHVAFIVGRPGRGGASPGSSDA